MKIFNMNDLPHQELESTATGEKFSLSSVLTDYLDFKDLFVHHEIIPPGKRSSNAHCHTHQEEMLLVLEGAPTVHLGLEERQLKPGDFVGFKPSAREFHFVENTSALDAHIVMICSTSLEDTIQYKTENKTPASG